MTERAVFGEGLLSRGAATVYTLMVVEALLLVTTAPGLVLLVLLDRDASNIPLAAACALPLGPGVSAALYALHHRRNDLTDLHPAAAFWRGYRLNLVAVLRLWAPLLAWLTVLAVSLAHFPAAGVPGWWRVPLVVVVVAALLWGVNALVIASLFAFRTRDVARLAAYFLARTPGAALGNAGVLAIAAAVTVFTSEAVLALLGSLLVRMLLSTCRPVVAAVHREFVA